MARRPHPALLFLAAAALPALAQAPERSSVVELELTQPTRWGESVYVLGDLPQLGGGDITRAVKMVPGDGGRWSLRVALPPGAAYEYAFWLRRDAAAAVTDPANGRPLGLRQRAVAPLLAARRVQVRYVSGFARVRLLHRLEDGAWSAVELQATGAGRGPGERAWTGQVETRTASLELRFEDGAGGVDLAPGRVPYRTGYDAFSVLEGTVHPGADGPLPVRERGRVVKIASWRSNLLGNARPVHIYLPRNYDRSARRYPVIYAHDGQNLFLGEGMFGGWHLDEALDELIDRGRLSEVIVVGVGNTSARMDEYIPDEDEGHASRYGRFLIEELKPWVDQSLRTLPDPDHTALLGSSLGGLVSTYLAWERPEVFGRAASLSGSFWLQAWVDRRLPGAPRTRLWIDSGSAGASGDSMWDTYRVRDALLQQGWVLGRDLGHMVDPGAPHQEPAWRGRVGQALEFLFPAR